MNTNYKIAIALVAGAAIGGAAIQGLHAQAKPPVYVIGENDVTSSRPDAGSLDEPPKRRALKPRHTSGAFFASSRYTAASQKPVQPASQDWDDPDRACHPAPCIRHRGDQSFDRVAGAEYKQGGL